jgi:hypothetical protein
VTELELLRRRRELVLLSAQLQRATIVRRLDHVQASKTRAALELVTKVASVPLALKLGSMAARFAVRTYQQRSLKKGRVGPTFKLLSFLQSFPFLRVLPTLKFLTR